MAATEPIMSEITLKKRNGKKFRTNCQEIVENVEKDMPSTWPTLHTAFFWKKYRMLANQPLV